MVDVHEVRVAGALASLGCRATVRRLAVGDFDLGNGVVVERKTVADLRASLADGRLWRQIGTLRAARIAYIVVEGPDVIPALRDADALRGALLAISDLGISVIRSRDPEDTARWLRLIERRRAAQPLRRRPPHVGRPPSKERRPAIRLLAAIDGVSEARVEALLARFKSIARIADASVADLSGTPGLHTKLAQRIYGTLH